MKSLEEILEAGLKRKGMTKSRFGEEVMGRTSNPFQGYYDILAGRVKLTPERIRKIAEVLELDVTEFSEPVLAARRAQQFNDVMNEFLEGPAKEFSPETVRRVRAILPGTKPTTVQQLIAIAVVFEGHYSLEEASVGLKTTEEALEKAVALFSTERARKGTRKVRKKNAKR